MREASKEQREHSYSIEVTVFGLADGIICFPGIIIGVAEATQRAVAIAGALVRPSAKALM